MLGLCLSTKHVAGFSILARSHFGKLKEPTEIDWSVFDLSSDIESLQITILSLVPTQIFELVQNRIRCPEAVKYIFVGGSSLSESLISGAKDLGWPIVACYGSTETFAQMSYSFDGKNFIPFSNWDFNKNDKKELLLKGPSLFEYTLVGEDLFKREQAEWHNTEDLAVLSKDGFLLNGKSNGLIKIKGSYFDFHAFKDKFENYLIKNELSNEAYFPVVVYEERNGAGVYLCTLKKVNYKTDKILNDFSELRGVFCIRDLKKTLIERLVSLTLKMF